MLEIRHQCSSSRLTLQPDKRSLSLPSPLLPAAPSLLTAAYQNSLQEAGRPSCTMSGAFCRRSPLWSPRTVVAERSQEPFPLTGTGLTAMSLRC